MLKISGNQSLMIGSMPQKNAREALDLLEQYPLSIPTWPQLPKRSFKEAMTPQYSEGFPGIRVDEAEKKIWVQRDEELMNTMAAFYEEIVAENIRAFAVSPDYAAGLHGFLEALANLSGPVPLIKGQVTGPFTFGLGLNDNEGKAVWFDEQYRDIVLKGITAKALWLMEQLKNHGERVVLFLDEPILSALGTAAYLSIQDQDVIDGLDEVIGAAQDAGGAVGVHCCGNMDWGLLARTKLDIISFDAYFYGEKLSLYPREIEAFLDRGGLLAFGIVPTADQAKLHRETPQNLREILDRLIDLFTQKGIPQEKIRNQMLYTPSCGLGFLPPDDSVKVLDLLSRLTDH